MDYGKGTCCHVWAAGFAYFLLLLVWLLLSYPGGRKIILEVLCQKYLTLSFGVIEKVGDVKLLENGFDVTSNDFVVELS